MSFCDFGGAGVAGFTMVRVGPKPRKPHPSVWVEQMIGAHQVGYLLAHGPGAAQKPIGQLHRDPGPFEAVPKEGRNLVVYLDLLASTQTHRDAVAMG